MVKVLHHRFQFNLFLILSWDCIEHRSHVTLARVLSNVIYLHLCLVLLHLLQGLEVVVNSLLNELDVWVALIHFIVYLCCLILNLCEAHVTKLIVDVIINIGIKQ